MKRLLLLLILSTLPAIGIAQLRNKDTKPINIPEYFLGTFEDNVPKLVGGTQPEIIFTVTCTTVKGCGVGFGADGTDWYDKISPPESLQAAKSALQYAKAHKAIASTSPMAWEAKNLKPLLDSEADIESCINLGGGGHGMPDLPEGAPGYMALCKLTKNPWPKQSVLVLGMNMSNCGELFCGYEIFVAFRK
ncbi:hypothetical protein [Rhodoferax sp. GW822-FHT02A01]|uniref:hypothetical protein n=1 Tax=Rhodoferax sp. GW822-FHT02A01 TaxID=3141537 RepID=UPI00315CB750